MDYHIHQCRMPKLSDVGSWVVYPRAVVWWGGGALLMQLQPIYTKWITPCIPSIFCPACIYNYIRICSVFSSTSASIKKKKNYTLALKGLLANFPCSYFGMVVGRCSTLSAHVRLLLFYLRRKSWMAAHIAARASAELHNNEIHS